MVPRFTFSAPTSMGPLQSGSHFARYHDQQHPGLSNDGLDAETTIHISVYLHGAAEETAQEDCCDRRGGRLLYLRQTGGRV